MTTLIPLPAGLPLDTASWEQTPLVVRQAVVQLPEIQMPVAYIVLHETRCSRRGRRLNAELLAEYRSMGMGPR